MSANRINCPLCQASIKAPLLPPGSACNCPRCGGQFRLGGESQPAPAVSDGMEFIDPPAARTPFAPSPAPHPTPIHSPLARVEQPESYPELIAPEQNEPEPDELPITCNLCGSRYYAPRENLGQQVACPDCHSRNVLKLPPPKSKKAHVVETGDEYDFKDEPLPPRPQDAAPLPAVLRGNEAPPAVTPPPLPGEGAVNKELAAAMLAKAKAELDERLPDHTDINEDLKPFFHGTITSLAQGPGIALLILLGIGLTLLVYDFRYIREKFSDGLSLEHIFVVGFMTIGLAVLPVVLGTLAATCQAIVQDTAEGMKRIENWPTLSFHEWLGNAALIMAATFCAAIPGLLLVTPGTMVMRSPGLMVPGVVLTSLWALFPIVFLSMSDAGSVVGVATPKILRSFGPSGERWFLFYFVSLLLSFGAFFAIAVMLEAQSSIVVPVCCLALVAEAFVYSRWLGRLAWFIARDEAREEEKAERADQLVRRVA